MPIPFSCFAWALSAWLKKNKDIYFNPFHLVPFKRATVKINTVGGDGLFLKIPRETCLPKLVCHILAIYLKVNVKLFVTMRFVSKRSNCARFMHYVHVCML